MITTHFIDFAIALAASTGTFTDSTPPGSEATTRPTVTWVDFDSDGHLDAHLFGPASNHLLRSTGNGTFEDVSKSAGLAKLGGLRFALWEDFDADGAIDLIVGTTSGRNALYSNLGGGAFGDSTAETGLRSVMPATAGQWFDFDGDGWKDLWLEGERGATLLRNINGQSFEPVELGIEALGVAPLTNFAITIDGAAAGDLGAGQNRATTSGPGASSAGQTPLLTKGKGIVSSAPSLLPPPTGGPVRRPVDPMLISAPVSLDAEYVNDNENEVDSADVADGSLVGADVSTSSGDVTHTGGSLGVGVTNPTAELHVDGDARFQGSAGLVNLNMDNGTGPVLAMTGTSVFGETGRVEMRQPNGTGFDTFYDGDADEFVLQPYFQGSPGQSQTTIDINGDMHWRGAFSQARLNLDTDAQAGVTLEMRSTAASGGDDFFPAQIAMRDLADDGFNIKQFTSGSGKLLFDRVTGGAFDGTLMSIDRNTGNVGIGTFNAATKLDVDGAITIRGGADIVETFESSCGVLEPGTVVVIDPNNPGELMCSATRFDTKVAGVVSGAGGVNPGILLGQDDMFTGDTKVAMTGRVYVKCSAENGPIVPGDRLTTATLEGYAMRVADGDKVDGAVLGKAMSRLEEGTGLVLVLVNLQ